MLKLIAGAALAATITIAPAANSAPSVERADVRASAVTARAAPQVAPALPPEAEFGVVPNADAQTTGLAPGQDAATFRHWLGSSAENRAQLGAFRNYLAAQGVADVVPMWQLVRTSSSWRDCGAQPFETPPADKWDHIVKTLQFVADNVVPAVGKVEALSGYRNEGLNACSNGARQSAHRHFYALDLAPVNAAVDRTAMIRSICAAHAREGSRYETGLGFYTGRRFHVDSSGFRKWGPNGRGATSPCVSGSARA